jgi:hypothetical protein
MVSIRVSDPPWIQRGGEREREREREREGEGERERERENMNPSLCVPKLKSGRLFEEEVVSAKVLKGCQFPKPQGSWEEHSNFP